MKLFSLLNLPQNVDTLRNAQSPGFIFLRNYKKKHMGRIEQTIAEMRGETNIKTASIAYDEAGKPLPLKFAVYAANNEVASLFFQYYQEVKSAEANKPTID